MWHTMFNAGNIIALIAWALLILGPRKALVAAVILYCGVGLLCLAYAIGLLGLLTGTIDSGGSAAEAGFTTIEGVRAMSANDAGVAIGWLHYLAFDLFVGLWIAKDADAKDFTRIVQAPILMATFMAGPLGLLIWLAVREKRARSLHGRSK
ncbi:MAG: ABA4-like family protein [Pontixanthobacter sp.]